MPYRNFVTTRSSVQKCLACNCQAKSCSTATYTISNQYLMTMCAPASWLPLSATLILDSLSMSCTINSLNLALRSLNILNYAASTAPLPPYAAQQARISVVLIKQLSPWGLGLLHQLMGFPKLVRLLSPPVRDTHSTSSQTGCRGTC